jgi:homoserine acetyltransferase
MISRYTAARTHDVSVPYGGDMRKALARVTAKVPVMPSMTDRTVPVSLAREMYRGLPNAIWQEIPECRWAPYVRGHDPGQGQLPCESYRQSRRVTPTRRLPIFAA